MKKLLTAAFISTFTLALAACGSSDDAATEAEADTVELPADEAMEDVTAEPVADPAATTPTPGATETTTPDRGGGDARRAPPARCGAGRRRSGRRCCRMTLLAHHQERTRA